MAHPPWELSGEFLVARVGRHPGRAGRLPPGLDPLPGPAWVVAVSYTDSPIGPFRELTIAEPARLGLRPGMCIVAAAVSTLAARVDYRLNWGFPADAATLQWDQDGPVRRMAWLERGLLLEGAGGRFRVPAALPIPVRSVQIRADGPVVVPRRVRGRARFGRVTMKVPEGDPLEWASGTHLGAVVTGMRMVIDPARHPAGLLSSLRAPLQAPGTGLTATVGVPDPPRASGRVTGPRAYGSVG